MTLLPTSLRLRLVLGLALANLLLWGSVALWRSHSLESELNAMLDERLVASAKMVAGIVHQFEPAPGSAADAPVTQGAAIAQALALAVQQSRQRAQTEPGPLAPIEVAQTPADPAAWQAVAVALPPALLTCAVTNLLDNALRHHQGQEPVRVALQWQAPAGGAPQVSISVRDQGPGLTAQECTQALQRFWRRDASTTGSGLGLTIVRRIAESAGGTLTLEPAQPGLRARLCVPTVGENP